MAPAPRPRALSTADGMEPSSGKRSAPWNRGVKPGEPRGRRGEPSKNLNGFRSSAPLSPDGGVGQPPRSFCPRGRGVSPIVASPGGLRKKSRPLSCRRSRRRQSSGRRGPWRDRAAGGDDRASLADAAACGAAPAPRRSRRVGERASRFTARGTLDEPSSPPRSTPSTGGSRAYGARCARAGRVRGRDGRNC